MRGRASVAIELSDEERSFLDAPLRKHKAERSLSDRCRIVLRCAQGLTGKEVARDLGHAEHTVGKGRRRFAAHRIEGLSDEDRAGRPRRMSDAQVAEIIEWIPIKLGQFSLPLASGETPFRRARTQKLARDESP